MSFGINAYDSICGNAKGQRRGSFKPLHFCPTIFALFFLVRCCNLKRFMVEAAGIEPASYQIKPMIPDVYKKPHYFRPTYPHN